MERNYFVVSIADYRRLVEREAHSWWSVGYSSGDLTADVVRDKYRAIAWITEDEACFAATRRAGYVARSADDLTNDLIAEIARLDAADHMEVLIL